MKKIWSICIGTILATSSIIVTPIVLTSCSNNNSVNENPKLDKNYLLKDKCFYLYQAALGSKLVRLPETNDFLYYVGEDVIEPKQFYCVREGSYLSNYLTPTQIKGLGFDSKKGPLSFDLNFITNDGKRVHYYKSQTMFGNYDKTKPLKFNLELNVMQGNNPSSLIHRVDVPFTITMIPGKAPN